MSNYTQMALANIVDEIKVEGDKDTDYYVGAILSAVKRDNDEVEQMEGHIDSLRELLQDLDLDVHNDESNEDHVSQALAGLDVVESHISDLTP